MMSMLKLELMQQIEDNRRRKMMEKQKEWEEDERQRIRYARFKNMSREQYRISTFLGMRYTTNECDEKWRKKEDENERKP